MTAPRSASRPAVPLPPRVIRRTIAISTSTLALALLTLAGWATAVGASPADDDTRPIAGSTETDGHQLEVVHLGQYRGRLEPTIVTTEVDGTSIEIEAGGWARTVTAIAEVRPPEGPEADSVLAIHTGGVVGATALGQVFGGAVVADLLGHACIDYVAPDADDRFRPDDLDQLIDLVDERCDTSVLGATEPAVAVHAADGNPVGLVAVEQGRAASDPVAGIAGLVERLVADGIDTIVLVSDLGPAADRDLVARLPAVDAVVGGGPDGRPGRLEPPGVEPDGPYPVVAINADGEPVCIGHTGSAIGAIGILRLELDATGEVVGCSGRRRLPVGRFTAVTGAEPLDGPTRTAIARAIDEHPELVATEPDPDTVAALQRWSAALDAVLDDPVATVTDDICRTAVPGRSVGLLCGPADRLVDVTGARPDVQRLVADALRHWGQVAPAEAANHGRGPDAGAGAAGTIAVVDSGTVSVGLTPGSLTRVAAYRLVGRRTQLATVELTGAEVLAVLEEMMAAALAPSTPGSVAADHYPHTSGLRWKPDLSQPVGARAGPVELVGDDGDPVALDPAARYRVVTTQALAGPASASTTLRRAAGDGRVVAINVGAAEALLAYVDRTLAGIIDPPRPAPLGPGPGPEHLGRQGG